MEPSNWKDLTGDVRQIWDTNAAYWDERMGPEGNLFHRRIVAPATERLLGVRPGEAVLDVACGNGNYTRRLAEQGARVVAFDLSAAMIERARAHTREHAERVDYRVLDASDEEALLGLGEAGAFDAALANMALMDMPEIDPLLRALAVLLRPGGRFVFSVTHPCFNSVKFARFAEEEDVEGKIVERFGVRVWGYARPEACKGLALAEQPAAQYYFHRPIEMLFAAGFRAGFVLDGLEEPVFTGEEERGRGFNWDLFRVLPPALIARLRLLGQAGE